MFSSLSRSLALASPGLLVLALLPSTVIAQEAHPRVVQYDLHIARAEVNVTGKSVRAITINGGIPGPMLTFTEGDTAVVRVHNDLGEETSIHWHGLLLPNAMDGVPYVTTYPIYAGKTHEFRFPLIQSGTYWYHGHSGFQEQLGVYGSIVILPRQPRQPVALEKLVLFSDWTDENPHSIMRTLKSGSHWYQVRKNTVVSLDRLIATGNLGNRIRQSFERMPPMDVSDVYYDAFLVNGIREESVENLNPGDKVRLRIINGSASTYFNVAFAGGSMTIVSADGLDVEPIRVQSAMVAIAETYDVEVTLPDSGSYEFRATAQDGTGHASIFLGSGARVPAPDYEAPDMLSPMNHEGMEGMDHEGTDGMDHGDMDHGSMDHEGVIGEADVQRAKPDPMEAMNHANMDHGGTVDVAGEASAAAADESEDHAEHTDSLQYAPSVKTVEDDPDTVSNVDSSAGPGDDHARAQQDQNTPFVVKISDLQVHDNHDAPEKTTGAPVKFDDAPAAILNYSMLRSERATTLPPDAPTRTYRLELNGDMTRYVWTVNNQTLSEADVLLIKRGENVRFELVNRTMMNHPMHLHGHFFRVLNGQGDHAPLKHTVDVAPMATTVIEFEASEEKDWFFHCHVLYHMMSGMSRIVSYDGSPVAPDLAQARQTKGMDHDKMWFPWAEFQVASNSSTANLSFSNTRNGIGAHWRADWTGEYELEADYRRFIGKHLVLFAGAEFAETEIGTAGVRYMWPLFVETEVRIDSDGGLRAMAQKHHTLTRRLRLHWEVDTDEEWRIELGYVATKVGRLSANYDSEYGFGAGVGVRY